MRLWSSACTHRGRSCVQAFVYGAGADTPAGDGPGAHPRNARGGEALLLLILERSADMRAPVAAGAPATLRVTNPLLLSQVQRAAAVGGASAAPSAPSHPLHYRSRDAAGEDIRGSGTAALVRTNALTQSIFSEALSHRGAPPHDPPLAGGLPRQPFSHSRFSSRSMEHPLISRQVRCMRATARAPCSLHACVSPAPTP
jgi:hypothetical protein